MLYSSNRIEWVNQPDMLVRRKDHACAMVKLGDTDGILVSGGVGENEQLLDSVEFFSIADQTWKEMAPLKMPRTEHGQRQYLQALFLCAPFLSKKFTFSRAHSHALTNAMRCHEYFRGLSRLLPVPGVLVSFLELRFLVKMSLLPLRGLFERLRAASQSQQGHFSEKTKLKK